MNEVKEEQKLVKQEAEYFYVPMWSSIVKYDGLSLYEVLSSVDSELQREEDIRYEMYFGEIALMGLTDKMLNTNKKYEEKISKLYQEKQLPENLILVRSDGKLYELATGLSVDSIDLYLDIKKISKEEIYKILDENPNYYEYTKRLFSLFEENKEKSDEKKSNKILKKISGGKNN